ncbi:hypothetical protein BH24ACT5_BH24ACT5_14490 [soil metagenome]
MGAVGSTAPLVYGLAAALVVLGVFLASIGVHLVRTSRTDPAALGPLEVMGERSWWRSDPSGRNARLERARPDAAVPAVDGSHSTTAVVVAAPEAEAGAEAGVEVAGDAAAGEPARSAAETAWAPVADDANPDPSLTGPTPTPTPQPAPPIPTPPGPGPEPQPAPPTPMPPPPGPEPQPAPPIPAPPGPGPEPQPAPPVPGPPPDPDPVPQPGPTPGPIPGPEPGPIPQPAPPIPAVDRGIDPPAAIEQTGEVNEVDPPAE